VAQTQYVYVYRDKAQRVVYVGRGERLARAEAHINRSHNPVSAASSTPDSSLWRRPDHTTTRPSRGRWKRR